MRIEFTVSGKPPKKHGEWSMWARPDEAPKVALLRKKAVEARKKVGLNDCFHSSVKLELTVFASNLDNVGDLDNFITGVCDALQKADMKVKPLSGLFEDEEIRPEIPILFENDKKIISIVANKVRSDINSYFVVVESSEISQTV